MSTNGQSIRDQIWRAVDPAGESRAVVNKAIHGGQDIPDFLRRVGVNVDEAWDQLAGHGVQYREAIEGIEAAVRVLGPRGWAVMTMDTEPLRLAVQAAEEGREDEADNLLANQWECDGAWRLKRVCDRVGVMGATDPELSG